jgi:methyl-accepting chemotaxis protein
MASLANLKVSSRLRLLALVSLAVFTIVVWEAISSFDEVLGEERAIKTQHVVESAHGVIVEFHARELAGELTRDEAQKGAMATIKRLRYGEEYFWINDMHPRMVMHPIRPDLDGKDLRENKDPTGKHLFVEFVDVVRKSGAGFVEYLWPKPGSSEPQPKISYVKGFEPWGWVIGNGVYTSDLAAIFWRHASHTLILATVGLACMLGLSWAIGRSILGQLGGEPTYLQQIAGHIAARDLTTHVKVALGDTRSITFAVEQMQGRLAEVIRHIRENVHDVTGAVRQAAEAGRSIHESSMRQTEVAGGTAAAIEQMAVSIAHVSANTVEARGNSERTAELAGRGEGLARDASEGIAQISSTVTAAARQIQVLRDRSGQIGEIAEVIREISDQTNLLALNAAIEAARAGEQGRGFAVVADEVRKLAERTGAATAQISQVIVSVKAETESAVASIEQIVPKVESGARLSKEAAEALRQIREGAHDTLERLEDVVSSMKELSAASNSVATNMQEVAEMAERSSAEIRGSAESSEKLKHSAEALEHLTEGFRVG